VTAAARPDEVDLLIGKMKTAAAPLREVLRDVHSRISAVDDGRVADYIPELAKADRRSFGIALATTDGQVIEVGDCQQLFTIQSISKPFVYGLALEDHGLDHVLSKVGVEPTGEAFNAIVLDEASNRPFNPMVNAGAIATADLIKGRDFPERLTRLLAMFSRYCGRDVGEQIAESLELYFQQCSILVNCRDLAVMGATLARGGINPLTGQRAIEQQYVKYLLGIMLSCGMYDYAGEWAYRVGIPAKSGVGGGIVGVIPGQFGIATFSPSLDAKGNSARGILAFRELSQRFGLHAFESGFQGPRLGDLLTPVRQSGRP
jgi:glutaminase